jgi:hypothetical protein
VDPVPDPLLLRKSGSAGNRTRTSGSVARNPDRDPEMFEPGVELLEHCLAEDVGSCELALACPGCSLFADSVAVGLPL